MIGRHFRNPRARVSLRGAEDDVVGVVFVFGVVVKDRFWCNGDIDVVHLIHVSVL